MQQSEALRLLLSNRRLFIETLVRIEDKSRNLVPYVLNPIQVDIDATSSGRDVYVKAAQVGASSYFICDFLIDCLTIPGTTAIIISYDEFISSRLLRKAQVFYEALKAAIPTIDEMHHKSTFEKTFERTHSSFYISSARSFSGVRGEPIHDLLLDEFAFWQPGDAEKIFAAALQRVPITPERKTKVRIVSTPNGEDNDFHEVYMAAKEGKELGKSTFKHHFYPWFMHPEYSLPFDSAYALPQDQKEVLDNITPDELKLVANFGVSMDQIRWRRMKIAEMSSLRRTGETALLFGQEYPEDDVTCFQSAGDMVLDSDLVNEKAKDCYPAPIRHLYTDIWYPPETGLKYLIAIDPGQGKVSESVATVWHFSTETIEDKPVEVFKHCATLSGFYDEPDMAEKCKALGYYYNGALLAPENNLSIVPHLTDYPDLYYLQDPISGKTKNIVGWNTNNSTKPYMIRELAVSLYKILTHDIRLVSQMRNIRYIGVGAQKRPMSIGADDYFMSAAIGIVCRDSLPIERGLVGTWGWNDSWGR